MAIYYWTLVVGQVAAGLATTTNKQSLFQYGLPNHTLTFCIVLEILLALAVVYVPGLNHAFKTAPLSMPQLIASAAMAFFLISIVEEMRKAFIRRRERATAVAEWKTK